MSASVSPGIEMEEVEKIADVVLYEGYLLYPYRRTALKNQHRWTFGGVYPRSYSEASGGNDPWSMQTQCLVVGDEDTRLAVKIRFLQVVDLRVARLVTQPEATEPQAENGAPRGMRFVEELRVGDQVYRPWEEAAERSVVVGGECDGQPPRLGELLAGGHRHAIDIPAGRAEETLRDQAGVVAGALVRSWRALQGLVEITAEPAPPGPEHASQPGTAYRLTVRIVNTAAWTPPDAPDARPRLSALRRAFVSTHTILRAHGGEFISLLEPPAEYRAAAEGCANIKTWPVLVGAQGERHTLLSSPIILYDYPAVSPESPGNLFDGTEIDELLTLGIMALTDEEKQEMRQTDARAREILDRTEGLMPEQLMKLHGAVRDLQPLRREE